jgi:hypothetical protein
VKNKKEWMLSSWYWCGAFMRGFYAAMLRFVFGVVSCLGAFGVMGVVGMKFGELVVR